MIGLTGILRGATMRTIFIEIAVIVGLILANGLFAMSELAVISARKVRLKQRADEGNQGARIALELANDPNRFLATVQIGMTLVGTLAGAFGGVALAAPLGVHLETIGFLHPYGQAVALGGIALLITYLTVWLGELVPKRVALARPEEIASWVARPLRWLSVLGIPLVRILSASTELLLRLLRIRASQEPPITEEELQHLLRIGTEAGVFAESERALVRRVFRLGDRTAGELITPRHAIVWLDVNDRLETLREKLAESQRSRYPVCDGSIDHVLGYVSVTDLLLRVMTGQSLGFRGLLRLPLFFYEGVPAIRVLETFRATGNHFGIVLDEFGSIEGLLTPSDILRALVGELMESNEVKRGSPVVRPDGSWLVDGSMPIDELEDILDGDRLPTGDYRTLAGYIVARLGRIPVPSDCVTWGRWSFEVLDMDGNRVDKVLINLAHPPGAKPQAAQPRT